MARRTTSLAFAAWVALVVPAGAANLLRADSGDWVHQHTRSLIYRIDSSVPEWLAIPVRQAALDWDNALACCTIRETNDDPNVTVRAGRYGPERGRAFRAWVGDAQTGQTPPRPHEPAVMVFNLDVLPVNNLRYKLEDRYKRIACHEWGHALGLAHGGRGCLRPEQSQAQDFAVDWLTGRSRPSQVTFYLLFGIEAARAHPGTDDVALLDRTYAATH